MKGISGTIPWNKSLLKRLSLLRGVSEEVFMDTAESMQVREYVPATLKELHREGWAIYIVTGGFDILEKVLIRNNVSYEGYISHSLISREGKLQGGIRRYRDKGEVARKLKKLINPTVTVAVGDGHNDIGMFMESDIAIGFKPKKTVEPYIHLKIDEFRDLEHYLYLLRDT